MMCAAMKDFLTTLLNEARVLRALDHGTVTATTRVKYVDPRDGHSACLKYVACSKDGMNTRKAHTTHGQYLLCTKRQDTKSSSTPWTGSALESACTTFPSETQMILLAHALMLFDKGAQSRIYFRT